jgi:hypothetical protein
LQALGRHDEALAAFTLAWSTKKRSERAAMTRGAIAMLVALQPKEARTGLTPRWHRANCATKPLDVAYLANKVGDDATADSIFPRRPEGELKGITLLDAALSPGAGSTMRAESLVRRRHRASGRPDRLDPQRLLEVRRDVSNVSHTWGAYASLICGGRRRGVRAFRSRRPAAPRFQVGGESIGGHRSSATATARPLNCSGARSGRS